MRTWLYVPNDRSPTVSPWNAFDKVSETPRKVANSTNYLRLRFGTGSMGTGHTLEQLSSRLAPRSTIADNIFINSAALNSAKTDTRPSCGGGRDTTFFVSFFSLFFFFFIFLSFFVCFFTRSREPGWSSFFFFRRCHAFLRIHGRRRSPAACIRAAARLLIINKLIAASVEARLSRVNQDMPSR